MEWEDSGGVLLCTLYRCAYGALWGLAVPGTTQASPKQNRTNRGAERKWTSRKKKNGRFIFFEKMVGFYWYIIFTSKPWSALLKERKNTHKFIGEVACALCRLRPSLPHEKIPCVALEETTLPSMALKSLTSLPWPCFHFISLLWPYPSLLWPWKV